MTARTALTAVGAIAAVVAGCSVAALVAGAPARVAALVVLAVAAAAVGLTRGPTAVFAGDRRVRETPGVVDGAGQILRVGDAVRGGAGFDGPAESSFGRGVVVKVGRGESLVRLDVPGQVHPVTPGTLRRLA